MNKHPYLLKEVNSPTKGRMSFDEMLADLRAYMAEETKRTYDIVIGTDSHQHLRTDFVTAIVIHRVGAGGRYYWVREQVSNMGSLRNRIYEEALRSLEAAGKMTTGLYGIVQKSEHNFNLEVHVDIGENGETRNMIKEVVGMVMGSGYTVKMKPLGYGAFVVADRHT